jgi:hypothetical protein
MAEDAVLQQYDTRDSSKDAYRSKKLGNLWDVHQDAKDLDCGPTCAVFFRWGGASKTESAPTEGYDFKSDGKSAPTGAPRPAYGGTVQDLCVLMREESRSKNVESGAGLVPSEMAPILNKFAAVIGGQRYTWAIDEKKYGEIPSTKDARDDYLIKGAIDLEKRVGPLIGDVGCLLEINPCPKDSRMVTSHYVVVLDKDGKCFNPDPKANGPQPRDWLDLFERHAQVRRIKDPLRGYNGPVTSQILYAKAAGASDSDVKNGTLLGELDIKGASSTWGRNLIATGPGEFYSSSEEADFHAADKAWNNNTGCAVVVELPAGTFQVCEGKIVAKKMMQQQKHNDEFAQQADVDSADSPAGSLFASSPMSTLVCIKYGTGANPTLNNMLTPPDTRQKIESIRWNDQGKRWVLYTPGA